MRRGQWIDLATALAVFTYGALIQAPWLDNSPLGWLVPVILCGSWVFRQVRPTLVAWAMLGAAGLQAATAMQPLVADALLLGTVYNVAAHRRWRSTLPVLAAVLVWIGFMLVPRLDEFYLNPGDLGLIIAMVTLACVIGTLVRTRRLHMETLEERARQLEREQEAVKAAAAAKERTRIAREIHDVVSHTLSSAVILADGAAHKVASEPERAEKAMIMVRDAGREAMVEMRRMLDVLHEESSGGRTPQPGVADVAHLVDQARATSLPVELTLEGDWEDVSSGVGLAVYRTVQEALTNVRKHAHDVSHVEVKVRCVANHVQVRVADDGTGLRDESPAMGEVSCTSSGGGHGLVGMRERVRTLGGTVRAGARAGGGFEIVAEMPARSAG